MPSPKQAILPTSAVTWRGTLQVKNCSARRGKVCQFLAAAIESDEQSGITKIGDELLEMAAELEPGRCLMLRGQGKNEEMCATVHGKIAFEEVGTLGKGDSTQIRTW